MAVDASQRPSLLTDIGVAELNQFQTVVSAANDFKAAVHATRQTVSRHRHLQQPLMASF